jgi:hypothetical protein
LALKQDAYKAERSAAESLAARFDLEPTRAMLYKGAAVLALELGLHRDAEKLACTGLAGNPPDYAANQLRSVLERANFNNHLALNGYEPPEPGFQLALAGNAIGDGKAAVKQVIDRYKNIVTLLYRTLGRIKKQPYKDTIGRIIRDYSVLVSVPRYGSFSATFEIVQHAEDHQLPGMDDATSTVDEVLRCLELFESGDDTELKTQIADEAYFNNFLGLAQQIAPDGDLVNLVGFTALRNGKERSVALSRRVKAIAIAGNTASSARRPRYIGPIEETITGIMRIADAPENGPGKVYISTQDGKRTVIVPEGMMADVVRPMYLDTVKVTGRRHVGRVIELQHISLAEESAP